MLRIGGLVVPDVEELDESADCGRVPLLEVNCSRGWFLGLCVFDNGFHGLRLCGEDAAVDEESFRAGLCEDFEYLGV